MELIHTVGRPRDGLVVVTFEKANCTQVVETMFKKLGLLDAAKAHHPFVYDFTRAQRRRILNVYNVDRQYRFKPLTPGHPGNIG